jgi:hypothetical protein
LPHLAFVWLKARTGEAAPAARGYVWQSFGAAALGVALVAALPALYSGVKYVNEFPADYNYLYGTNRPFAPSLAKTDTGGAFDGRSLAGSQSCGTVGCHAQIAQEWQPSAHRYAAMDKVFLGIQNVMAKQNGAESTRYCGGCHDPISLFSGTKNIFVENLTGLQGYQEGISCLACHAIRETDVKGNANYTVTQPREYLWQWQTNGLAKFARDFLIRSYPAEHGGQPPIGGRPRQRLARLVQEITFGEGNGYKICSSLAAVQDIRFAVFLKIAQGPDCKTVRKVRLGRGAPVAARHHLLAVHHLEGESGIQVVHQGRRPVIDKVKIQPPIAINVRNRHGLATLTRVEHHGMAVKFSLPVVVENLRAVPRRVDEEIQITIPVQVNQRTSGGA